MKILAVHLSEFSAAKLNREVRPQDTHRYGVLRQDHLRKNYIEGISEKIGSEEFKFGNFRTHKIRGTPVLSARFLGDTLVLRRLTSIINRAFGLHFSDRALIVNQTKALLKESTPKVIARRDFSKFYESVDRDGLLLSLAESNTLPRRCLELLELFFQSLPPEFSSGLPRGIALSATLSEFYMRDFDRALRDQPGIYYAARYVDDLIVFSNSTPEVLEAQLRDALPANVTFNLKKHQTIKVGCRCIPICICGSQCKCTPSKCKCVASFAQEPSLEFLGYRFAFDDVVQGKISAPRQVRTTISNAKVRRYKTRIVEAFLDFLKAPNFDLLVARTRFLSENRLLRSPTNRGRLKTGIFFNYTHIDDSAVLVELNRYLKALIYAKKGSFGSKVSGAFTLEQKEKLAIISFVAGHRQKRTHNIKPKEARAIRACWSR